MKTNNIESKTIVFRQPVEIWIMNGAKVSYELYNVKKIVEHIDSDGDALAEFFDDNMEYIDDIYIVESWDYYIP